MKTRLSLLETKKSLENRISTLTSFISTKDINAPVCPFCGKEQKLIDAPAGITVYRPCDCVGMKEYREAKNQLTELTQMMKDTGVELEMCSVRAARSLEKCHLGARFLNCSFDNFDRKFEKSSYLAALEYAEHFPENDGSGLILTGKAGTGKTHLAAAVLNYLVHELYVPACFWNHSDMLNHIRQSFTDIGKAEDIVQTMIDSPLFILDDLGKAKRSEWSDELLYRIVNNRYIDEKPIVITTNYDLNELASMVDESVLSRIFSTCKAVRMDGIDYRLKEYLPD